MNYDQAEKHTGSMMKVEPSQAPISSLSSAVEGLMKAASMAHETATRLCGSVPESAYGSGQSIPACAFDQIEEIAANIRTISDGIFTDMSRIQARL